VKTHAWEQTEYLAKINPDATLELFGQDWNEQAFAVCGSDMLIKGQALRAHLERYLISTLPETRPKRPSALPCRKCNSERQGT
jgi:hypothetical protein